MTSAVPYAEVIGDPISHSKSPLIHGFWLEKLGVGADYRLQHVRQVDLPSYFEARRADPQWRGCNVTLPHKEQILAFADVVDARAAAVGAGNCLFRDAEGRIVATNTDIDGVATAIEGLELRGEDVCVLGCGGAARAAFHALKGRGCHLLVLARNPEKAVSASSEAGDGGTGVLLRPGNTALAEAKLFINATQLGMDGQDPMPSFVLEELNDLAEDALVFDMVYAPLCTELLIAAKARGLRVADGLRMLVGQAAAAFELFFERPAPRAHDEQLRKLLTA